MRIVRTKAELRELLAAPRADGRTIGLVPTMGFLHEGHRSLLEAARERCDVVVMSLFVNPTQFRPGEDLEAYPRDETRDAEIAEAAGVDFVFAPSTEEVYPHGYTTSVIVEGLSEVLCGDPGRRGLEHFRGVTTVVAKLLNIVAPDVAFFGQKDAQQAIVIRRMVRDLDFAVRVDVLPTIREQDGLALSSRNVYLSEDERDRAPAINRALQRIREVALSDGPGGEVEAALAEAREILAAARIQPEYLEARDAETLEPIAVFNGRPVLVAVAAPLGRARLIDNVLISPGAEPEQPDPSPHPRAQKG
jgi:pantoate--beta-alanine ligase